MTSAATAPPSLPFVGRARELEELSRQLQAAVAGQQRLTLIRGQSGIGKTTLVEHFAAQSRATAEVLWAKCWENGAPPFWPWLQILRATEPAGDADPGDTLTLSSPMPEVAAAVVGAKDPERARFQLFDSVSRRLRSLAAQKPLLVIIDDIHAADLDSLLLLEFLLDPSQPTPIMVAATRRDGEAAGAAEITRICSRLGHRSTAIDLASLNAAAVAEYVERILGDESGASQQASAEIAANLLHLTQGHPLYMQEALRLWLAAPADRGSLAERSATLVPADLVAVVRHRLRLLPLPVQRLLAYAAVIGREFELPVLQRLAQDDHEDGAEIDVPAMLERAIQGGVIHAAGSRIGRYQFAHALFHTALQQEMPAAERARRHAGIAAILESSFRSGRTDVVADAVFHYVEALPIGTHGKVVEMASQAAAQATAACAYHDAVGFCRQALQAFDLDVSAAGAPDARVARRCDLLLSLGFALNLVSQCAEARDVFRQAATLARQVGDAERLGSAALGYGGARGHAGFGGDDTFHYDGPSPLDPTSAELLNQAIDAIGEGNMRLRARLLGRLGIEMYFIGAPEERDAVTREAVEIARDVGDLPTLAGVLAARLVATGGPDNLEERLRLCDEIIGLARRIGDHGLEILARSFNGSALLEAGDFVAMEANYEAARQLTQRDPLPLYAWGLKQHLVMRALLSGRFEGLDAAAEEARACGEGIHASSPIVYLIQMRAWRRATGRLAELEGEIDMLRMFAEQFPMMPQARIELAGNYVALGRIAEARGELDYLAAHDFKDMRRDPDWLYFTAALGDVCASAGDHQRAQLLYDALMPFAQRVAIPTFGSLCSGAVARVLGRLTHLMQRWAESERHFETALRLNFSLRSRPWLAETRYAYAAMLAERSSGGGGETDDAARAHALAVAAVEEARMLGMAPLAEQADALIRQLGEHSARAGSESAVARQEASNPSPPAGTHAFRIEGDYWALTYAGKTVRCRHSRGLAFIALLLRHPGHRFHSLELARARVNGTSVIVSEEEHADDGGGIAILDGRAKQEYRARVADLQAELDEAEATNDLGRSEQARAELEALTEELRRAVGLGGRDRHAANAAERARVNITRSIATALRKISDVHPDLGAHLAATIRTGLLCTYRPDPHTLIDWTT